MAKAAESGMEFHEAATIFPMDDETIDELAADIKKHGLLCPVEVLDGKIIDGRRRWMACRLAGVKASTVEVNPEDPIAYVLSLNLHRRHLTEVQRAMVGARAVAIYEEQAKERQKAVGGVGKKAVPVNLPEPVKGDARDLAGKAVGVSGKSIDSAKKVLRQGTPKLIAAADADHIAISTAARASSLSPQEQDAIAERAAESAKLGRKRQRAESNGHEEEEPEEGKRRGVGVIRANEAINCLSRIPKNDALRKRGFQLVTDWIKHNR